MEKNEVILDDGLILKPAIEFPILTVLFQPLSQNRTIIEISTIWFKRRIIYNIGNLIAAIPYLLVYHKIPLEYKENSISNIVVYVLFLNICFSLGSIIEIVFNGALAAVKVETAPIFGKALFIIGTVISILLSFLLAFITCILIDTAFIIND